tara:strand:+ start:905 stop:1528 length:624 start_codon:yes stop_codon:yes gene_type:complete
MHKSSVLIIGPEYFVNTIKEIDTHLKFKLELDAENFSNKLTKNLDVLLFHKVILETKEYKDIIYKSNLIKIFATEKENSFKDYDYLLKLPTTIGEINSMIESSIAKNVFNKNSSIKIKDFSLDKNEKKLFQNEKFIILTEKEIQLLELFLSKKEPISKDKILKLVWHYSSDADTHTVETHIYRLRKKINDKFLDDKFILNNKEGYYL